MTKRLQSARPLWEDRFATPCVEDLLGVLPPETNALARSMRETIAADPELVESLGWCGLPWRWALTYRPTGSIGEQDAVAFVVPNPEAPAVVFRLTREQFAELPVKKLSRFIREGFAQTRLVVGVCWPEWTFQSPTQVKELSDLFAMLRESALTEA